MAEESCCTCARNLSDISPEYDEKTEKPVQQDRRLNCCPFCQISSDPTPLPQGLRDPPAYSPPASPRPAHVPPAHSQYVEELPAYSSLDPQESPCGKGTESEYAADDVLHFINPAHDTISSLALRYAVPAHALRKKNNLYADHLLAARKAILIPGEYYSGGVSLSPEPVDGEEEEIRKSKIRRWMVICKVSDYDIALLYLGQAQYDLDRAVETYLADEKWEREHPLESSSKSKPTSKRTRRKFAAERTAYSKQHMREEELARYRKEVVAAAGITHVDLGEFVDGLSDVESKSEAQKAEYVATIDEAADSQLNHHQTNLNAIPVLITDPGPATTTPPSLSQSQPPTQLPSHIWIGLP
ncbi:MAG: hypothetical protein Q9170_001937 [Blastenia crenularia]